MFVRIVKVLIVACLIAVAAGKYLPEEYVSDKGVYDDSKLEQFIGNSLTSEEDGENSQNSIAAGTHVDEVATVDDELAENVNEDQASRSIQIFTSELQICLKNELNTI